MFCDKGNLNVVFKYCLHCGYKVCNDRPQFSMADLAKSASGYETFSVIHQSEKETLKRNICNHNLR